MPFTRVVPGLESERDACADAPLILSKDNGSAVHHIGPIAFGEKIAHVQQGFNVHPIMPDADGLAQIETQIRPHRADLVRSQLGYRIRRLPPVARMPSRPSSIENARKRNRIHLSATRLCCTEYLPEGRTRKCRHHERTAIGISQAHGIAAKSPLCRGYHSSA